MMPTRRQFLATLLASSVALGAQAALAQSVSPAEAAAIAKSRVGGGTVLGVRTLRNNGSSRHVVKILNPQGQVVTITVDGTR